MFDGWCRLHASATGFGDKDDSSRTFVKSRFLNDPIVPAECSLSKRTDLVCENALSQTNRCLTALSGSKYGQSVGECLKWCRDKAALGDATCDEALKTFCRIRTDPSCRCIHPHVQVRSIESSGQMALEGDRVCWYKPCRMDDAFLTSDMIKTSQNCEKKSRCVVDVVKNEVILSPACQTTSALPDAAFNAQSRAKMWTSNPDRHEQTVIYGEKRRAYRSASFRWVQPPSPRSA